MNPDVSVQYVVYNLATYFSDQPGDMRFCPDCKKLLLVSDIPKSRPVIEDLSHDRSMTKHYFTRLYQCSACNWWAVREAWESYLEREYDFLVVNTTGTTEARDKHSSPWSLVLETVDVYNEVIPLPDSLGKFFVDRRNNNTIKFKPGDKICLIADVGVYQPTLYFVRMRGSRGTIVAFEQYSAAMEQLKKRLKTEGVLGLELIDFKFWEAEFDLRKGFCYAVRIDKLEPSSGLYIEDTICSEGEVYLVEPLSLRKVS